MARVVGNRPRDRPPSSVSKRRFGRSYASEMSWLAFARVAGNGPLDLRARVVVVRGGGMAAGDESIQQRLVDFVERIVEPAQVGSPLPKCVRPSRATGRCRGLASSQASAKSAVPEPRAAAWRLSGGPFGNVTAPMTNGKAARNNSGAWEARHPIFRYRAGFCLERAPGRRGVVRVAARRGGYLHQGGPSPAPLVQCAKCLYWLTGSGATPSADDPVSPQASAARPSAGRGRAP